MTTSINQIVQYQLLFLMPLEVEMRRRDRRGRVHAVSSIQRRGIEPMNDGPSPSLATPGTEQIPVLLEVPRWKKDVPWQWTVGFYATW